MMGEFRVQTSSKRCVLTSREMGRYTRGAAPEGFHASSELLHLMADKATFLGHITNLHDELMLAIDTKEDEMHKIQNGHIQGHNTKLSDHEVKMPFATL